MNHFNFSKFSAIFIEIILSKQLHIFLSYLANKGSGSTWLWLSLSHIYRDIIEWTLRYCLDHPENLRSEKHAFYWFSVISVEIELSEYICMAQKCREWILTYNCNHIYRDTIEWASQYYLSHPENVGTEEDEFNQIPAISTCYSKFPQVHCSTLIYHLVRHVPGPNIEKLGNSHVIHTYPVVALVVSGDATNMQGFCN